MLIVKMVGGLANKMFQYSLYQSLIHAGKDAYIDNESFVPKWDFENIGLQQVFPRLDMRYAAKSAIQKLAGGQDVISKARRRMPFLSKKSYIRELSFGYNPTLFALEGDYYLEGCWQSEKYFQNIKNRIRGDFTFSGLTDRKNISLVDTFSQKESVSIHVRKGADYVRSNTDGTCNKDYYERAVQYINQRIQNPRFFVFTDNPSWVKNNLLNIEYTLIDWNPVSGPSSFLDMQLMSQCKHNIIANSTYSWWGAWLNPNPHKIVVGPKQWFSSAATHYDTADILSEEWISM